jgi:hypothetical protein
MRHDVIVHASAATDYRRRWPVNAILQGLADAVVLLGTRPAKRDWAVQCCFPAPRLLDSTKPNRSRQFRHSGLWSEDYLIDVRWAMAGAAHWNAKL